jgi:alpha-beta hydrolase superfamily lysophospholipase
MKPSNPIWRHALLSLLLCAAGLASAQTATPASATPQTCPTALPPDARCFTGKDSEGAWYWMALPKDWNQVLVLHSHGGPELGEPRQDRTAEDLSRWAVVVKAGYAWAGSSYRRGGYGVTMAAEDTERLRQLFVRQFGQPRRTVLHGQSYGGGVASKAAELYGATASTASPYDAVLLTSGVLGGGNLASDFRLDLRVVYQYVCNNHPRAGEAAYPLWMGLPAGSKLTRAQLSERVEECTGLQHPPALRTPAQQARLANILNVVKIPERSLLGHLGWATWLFQDVVRQRLGGRNPFGNEGVSYRGSSDDPALNAGVLRYRADPQAQAQLAADSVPNGRLTMPVLTLHAVDDPTAFVELESAYRDIVQKTGAGDRLVQVFSDEHEHSYLADPQYPALLAALLDWVDKGEKPTPATIATRCKALEAAWGKACHLLPGYQPGPLASRVPAR